MPQCSVCNHTEKEKLNVALINGTPLRDTEKLYKVSKSALGRHKQWCLPTIAAAALQAGTTDEEVGPEPETVEGKAREMCGKGRLAILQALKRKDYKTAFAGMREHHGYMETIGKITGEFSPPPGATERRPMFVLPANARIALIVDQPNAIEEGMRDVTPEKNPTTRRKQRVAHQLTMRRRAETSSTTHN
jgi:hypothetical protein